MAGALAAMESEEAVEFESRCRRCPVGGKRDSRSQEPKGASDVFFCKWFVCAYNYLALACSRGHLHISQMSRGNKKESQAASRQQFHSIEKEQHRFYSVEKDFDDASTMASTRQSEDAPLLEIDEKVSPWIVETSRPRSMRNTRCRIRRLLRLHRRRPGSRSGGNATKSPRKAKKTPQEPVKTHETIIDKGNGSSSQHWAYNLALGLAWYMPAPYDMMPVGYPSRVF